MGSFLINWKMNPAIVPATDQKERLKGLKGLTSLVLKDLEEGKFASWGAYGSGAGYAVVEGTISDAFTVMSKYAPWVLFEALPIMSAKELDVMFDGLLSP